MTASRQRTERTKTLSQKAHTEWDDDDVNVWLLRRPPHRHSANDISLVFFFCLFPTFSRRGCRDSNLKKKMKLFTKFDHIRALAHSNMERARLFWCWFGGRTMAIIIWVSFLISVHTHIRRRRFVRLAYNEATPKPFRPNVNLCVANAKRLHWNETWVCSGIASTTCRCVCPASRASTLRLRVLIIIIVYE